VRTGSKISSYKESGRRGNLTEQRFKIRIPVPMLLMRDILGSSNTKTVGSNTAQGMNVCLQLLCSAVKMEALRFSIIQGQMLLVISSAKDRYMYCKCVCGTKYGLTVTKFTT
jgi:hypothetical protein